MAAVVGSLDECHAWRRRAWLFPKRQLRVMVRVRSRRCFYGDWKVWNTTCGACVTWHFGSQRSGLRTGNVLLPFLATSICETNIFFKLNCVQARSTACVDVLNGKCLLKLCCYTKHEMLMTRRQEHQGFPGASAPGLQPGGVLGDAAGASASASGAAVPAVPAPGQAEAAHLHPQAEPRAAQPPARRDGVPPGRVRAARDEPAAPDPAARHPRGAGLGRRHGRRTRRGGHPLPLHAPGVGAPPDRTRGARLGRRLFLRQARAAARARVPRVQGGARGELAGRRLRGQQHRGAGPVRDQQPRVVGDEEGVHGPAERHRQHQAVRRAAQGGADAPQEHHGVRQGWRRRRHGTEVEEDANWHFSLGVNYVVTVVNFFCFYFLFGWEERGDER